jgi:hypothetical protein
MLNFVMLNVIVMNVVLLNFVMLSEVAPFSSNQSYLVHLKLQFKCLFSNGYMQLVTQLRPWENMNVSISKGSFTRPFSASNFAVLRTELLCFFNEPAD